MIRAWVFAVTFLVAASLSSTAFAWGYLELFTSFHGRGYLVTPVRERNEVRYCLYIDPAYAQKFDRKSMNVQITGAFQEWMRPVVEKKLLMAEPTITEVDCSSVDIDLKISVSQPHDRTSPGAFQDIINVAGRPVSLIKIDPVFTYEGDSFVDTMSLLSDRTLEGLKQELKRYGRKEGYPLYVFQKRVGTTFNQAHWSTFRVLLHEFGHALGLCDTQEGRRELCDMKFTTPQISGSVMSDSAYLSLTDDDKKGILKAFELY